MQRSEFYGGGEGVYLCYNKRYLPFREIMNLHNLKHFESFRWMMLMNCEMDFKVPHTGTYMCKYVKLDCVHFCM